MGPVLMFNVGRQVVGTYGLGGRILLSVTQNGATWCSKGAISSKSFQQSFLIFSRKTSNWFQIKLPTIYVYHRLEDTYRQGCGVDQISATPTPTPARKNRLRLQLRLQLRLRPTSVSFSHVEEQCFKTVVSSLQCLWCKLVSACMAWIRRRLSIRDMAIGPKEQVWAESVH